MCKTCFDTIHQNELLRGHVTTRLEYDKDINVPKEEAVIDPTTDFEDDEGQKWLKYEQFNFVTDRKHPEFTNLRYYFSFMKECYLQINNING